MASRTEAIISRRRVETVGRQSPVFEMKSRAPFAPVPFKLRTGASRSSFAFFLLLLNLLSVTALVWMHACGGV